MKILVASKNPVKINAVMQGFSQAFPQDKFEVDGLATASNVKDQPMSDDETLAGAMNRVTGLSQSAPADYWVGIEGGVHEHGSEMHVFAWVVIKSKAGKVSRARTATFTLPPKIVSLIHEGKELGEADDIVFGRSNSKQENGSVGLLTDNVIDRTAYYVHAVILALIPHNKTQLY